MNCIILPRYCLPFDRDNTPKMNIPPVIFLVICNEGELPHDKCVFNSK